MSRCAPAEALLARLQRHLWRRRALAVLQRAGWSLGALGLLLTALGAAGVWTVPGAGLLAASVLTVLAVLVACRSALRAVAPGEAAAAADGRLGCEGALGTWLAVRGAAPAPAVRFLERWLAARAPLALAQLAAEPGRAPVAATAQALAMGACSLLACASLSVVPAGEPPGRAADTSLTAQATSEPAPAGAPASPESGSPQAPRGGARAPGAGSEPAPGADAGGEAPEAPGEDAAAATTGGEPGRSGTASGGGSARGAGGVAAGEARDADLSRQLGDLLAGAARGRALAAGAGRGAATADARYAPDDARPLPPGRPTAAPGVTPARPPEQVRDGLDGPLALALRARLLAAAGPPT